jgi:hypothetical protein
MGCTVHVTPIVEALHQAAPDARIIGAMSGLAREVFRFYPRLERLETVLNPSRNLLSSSPRSAAFPHSSTGSLTAWC